MNVENENEENCTIQLCSLQNFMLFEAHPLSVVRSTLILLYTGSENVSSNYCYEELISVNLML